MKKYICNPLWLLLLFVAFISSCDKEEIVFDHELPQFELRSDAILLEVIMPQGTGADEIIYIAGDFNGGQDAASGFTGKTDADLFLCKPYSIADEIFKNTVEYFGIQRDFLF